MSEVGFLRRAAPAVCLALGGAALLHALPSGADSGTTADADFAVPQPTGSASPGAASAAPGGRFQPYTNRAIPGMKSQILAAQSTRVAAVSGATYTSQAYAQSVQSALDRA